MLEVLIFILLPSGWFPAPLRSSFLFSSDSIVALPSSNPTSRAHDVYVQFVPLPPYPIVSLLNYPCGLLLCCSNGSNCSNLNNPKIVPSVFPCGLFKLFDTHPPQTIQKNGSHGALRNATSVPLKSTSPSLVATVESKTSIAVQWGPKNLWIMGLEPKGVGLTDHIGFLGIYELYQIVDELKL